MELTWAEYRISIRVQRKQADSTPDSRARRVCQPRLPQERREDEKQYLLASGNRYVAPTR
jgi:hypothetical protein